jgi:hypothetical protein
MKVSKSARGVALALITMLALSGFAVAVNAEEEEGLGKAPRWRIKGAYLTKTEEKKLEGTNTERVLLEVPNKTVLVLEFPKGKCKMEGKIKGSEPLEPGTKKEVVLDCNSVVVFEPANCTVKGVGQTTGLLKTKNLKSTLVWRNNKFGVTEDLLTAETGGVIAEFEVEGGSCPAGTKGKYVVEKELLDELKPTGEDTKVGTILLPEPPLSEWWDNGNPRVKRGITQLAVSGTKSILRGAFSYEIEGLEFGIYAK